MIVFVYDLKAYENHDWVPMSWLFYTICSNGLFQDLPWAQLCVFYASNL